MFNTDGAPCDTVINGAAVLLPVFFTLANTVPVSPGNVSLKITVTLPSEPVTADGALSVPWLNPLVENTMVALATTEPPARVSSKMIGTPAAPWSAGIGPPPPREIRPIGGAATRAMIGALRRWVAPGAQPPAAPHAEMPPAVA